MQILAIFYNYRTFVAYFWVKSWKWHWNKIFKKFEVPYLMTTFATQICLILFKDTYVMIFNLPGKIRPMSNADDPFFRDWCPFLLEPRMFVPASDKKYIVMFNNKNRMASAMQVRGGFSGFKNKSPQTPPISLVWLILRCQGVSLPATKIPQRCFLSSSHLPIIISHCSKRIFE